MNVVALAPRVSVELSAIRHEGIPLPELLHHHRALHLPKLRAHTGRQYERLAALVSGLPGHPSPPELSHFWNALRAQGMAPSYLDLLQRSLHAVFAWGNDAALIRGNPCAFVERPRLAWKPRAIPKLNEIWSELLAVVGAVRSRGVPWGLRAQAFVATLRFQGLRRGEALALTTEKVVAPWRAPPATRAWDPKRWAKETMKGMEKVPQLGLHDGWTMRVDCQRDAPNSWKCSPLKTDRSARIMEVAAPLLPLLDGLLRGPKAQVGRSKTTMVTTDFLFPFREHDLGAMAKAMVGTFPRHFEGLSAVWHSFRHTFAEDLSKAGIAREDIQHHLGHASVATTELYLRGLEGQRVKGGVLGKVFGNDERGAS